MIQIISLLAVISLFASVFIGFQYAWFGLGWVACLSAYMLITGQDVFEDDEEW